MTDKKEIISYIVLIVICFILAMHMNVVVSGSMEPTFYRGDIVIIEKTNFLGFQEFNPEDVEVGDIVVYDASWYNKPVIHRVINKTTIEGETYFTIKGDNNPVQDPYPVPVSQIRERVINIENTPLIVPKIGYVSLWLRGL
ncbi:signal peptidase I [Methanobrevibacter curvatus]|uniref:Signal peptidase I n=1 Tax=Methanobrevibacter curvatus TaxID=49547 RepID=A0A166C9U1_9EURY|nr:signal peptidase I [Methanobrevibacter curvatus]KZX12537.1 signal peptidase I W [Methanobrevibacter curvatus]